MSFLLKIVQGPNAGAEIALAEGTTVSFGRGDSCDIILTDSALEEKAFELEVTSERVMMLFPEGTQSRMELFHARTVGTTVFVVGPGEGAWKEIVYESSEYGVRSKESKESSEFGVRSSESDNSSEADDNKGKKKKRRGCGIGCIVGLVILLLIAGIVAFWIVKPEKVSTMTGGRSDKVAAFAKPYYVKCRSVVGKLYKTKAEKEAEREALKKQAEKEAEEAASRLAENLAALVDEYGAKSETLPSGKMKITGDFKTRIERLQATARIYNLKPGVELDFTDQESLTTAIENVLVLVSEGRIKLDSIDGRTAKFKGIASSEQDLRKTLEAISKDVPKLVSADCAGVTISGISTIKDVIQEARGASEEVEGIIVTQTASTLVESKEDTPPVLPVVGILTSPYPCLVLQNGSRIMEGARFGEYTVKSITADSVELSNGAGSFTWRP